MAGLARAALLATIVTVAGLNGSAAAQSCAGDCNLSGSVTIAELQTAVLISLGIFDVDRCRPVDADRNDRADIYELVAAVSAALDDCHAGASVGVEYTCPWREDGIETIHAFLLAGQSNMRGVGQLSQLPAAMFRAEPRILDFRDQWQPLLPARGHFGPELSFARTMAAACPESTIGVVKYAVSNTGINAWLREWDPAKAALSNDAGLGPLYPILMEQAGAADAAATVSWEGFVWVQGHGDMDVLELAQRYGENLRTLVTTAREDLGDDQLPFIFEYQIPAPPTDPWILELLPVGFFTVEEQKWQAQFDIAHSYAADFTNLQTIDLVHFTSESYLIAGKRLAEAFLLRDADNP